MGQLCGCHYSKPPAPQEDSELSQEEKKDKCNEVAAAAETPENAKAATNLSEDEENNFPSEAAMDGTKSETKSESGRLLSEEEKKTKKWNKAAVEMAENAKGAKDLSVDDRVKLIEKNYATVWKMNHSIDADSLRSVVDPASWSDDVKDSWNWRRRFAQVSLDASDVHIKYLSEKENLEMVDLCSLSRTSGNVQIFDLPQLDFKKLEGQALDERWSHAQEHELCVGFSALKKALDVHYGFPKHVYPVLVAWKDSSNTSQSLVFALVSKASKQAWLQCLAKSLPDALQGQPSSKANAV